METWKIIKNLSIADQPKEKKHSNNCYDITIIIVDHFLNTKTKNIFKIVYSWCALERWNTPAL